MAFAIASSTAREPLSDINTTPLIDVLLVLLIVMVMAVPLATNSLEVPTPGEVDKPHPVKNLLVIETDGDLLWNGSPIDEHGLAGQLAQVRAMSPEPEVQFRPEANASYARSAAILLLVKRSRIENFGMIGNEQYRAFGRR